MKRWLGLFAVLMVAGAAAWFVARQMEPLESRFSRVQIGMTRAEVESIMGRGKDVPGHGPPGGRLYWKDGGCTCLATFEDERIRRKLMHP